MPSILTYRRARSTFSRAPQHSQSQTSSSSDDSTCSCSKALLAIEAIPEWYRDNSFIKSGYRGVSYSVWACLSSLTSIHNETVNIYTHLIPAVLFFFSQWLVQDAISHYFPQATTLDRIVFACNVTAGIITMSLSSLYHTFMCHSQHISHLWLRIDYVGILTLILGSFFSGIYVGFYCEPKLRTTYWSMIITLSTITSVLVLHPRLQGLRYRSHRTWAFIFTSLSGFAPLIHGSCLYGWSSMWTRSGMPYYLSEGLVYGIGAFFFVTRIPESIWPGKFDIWLSSHQIFHMFVVAGCLVHFYGVWNAFSWNYNNQRVCPAFP